MKKGYYFVKYGGEWEVANYMNPCWFLTGSERSMVMEEFDEIGEFIGETSEEVEQLNKKIGVIRLSKIKLIKL